MVVLQPHESAAAIQKAIDGDSSPNGAIYFSPGVYNLGQIGLTISGPRTLIGAGCGGDFGTSGSVIQYRGSGAALTINPGTKGLATHGFAIRDLHFDGVGQGSVGIEVGNSSGSPRSAGGLLDNITVARFTVAGLRCVSAQLLEARRLQCLGNRGDGLLCEVVSGGSNNAHIYTACVFVGNHGAGARLRQIRNAAFIGCDFENNRQEGVRIESTNGAARLVQFTHGTRWEGNLTASGTHQLYVAGPTAGLRLSGCSFSGAAKHVRLEGCTKALVEQCIFSGSSYGDLDGAANSVRFYDEDPANWTGEGGTFN